jgi:DNA-binding NarL/FixJ family response regulator
MLTRRQLILADLLRTSDEHLHVGNGTVKTHIGHLLAKLHARDRAQLVIAAYESNLVRPRRRPG